MSSSSDNSAPPPDGSSSNNNNNDSPPSSAGNSSSPPPNPDSSTTPPPPPSDNNSPPPPSSDNNPPPPSDDHSSSPSPPSSDTGTGSGGSSNNPSPPPPPPKSDGGNNNPPSPPSSNNRTPPSSSSSGSALAPPRSASSSSGSNSQDHTNQIIVGVVVGGGLLLIMFILCCIMCRCGKKKKRKPDQYYGGPPTGGMMYSGEYYPSSQQQWQASDHIVKLNPPPGGMGGGGGGWPAPPPPPPMMSSGEMSGNYSSGPRQPPLPPPSPTMALGFNQSTFTYDELASATGGFAQSNLLGQGGFGYVHKGVLPNGKEIAVKSLKMGSGQGEREFQAEVEIISRVHHRHLVSLVGYCIAGGQRMLVYEFVPNKTLEYHLHGHPRIIHRDIKAANILIDYNFEAMVADFGLAKLSSDNNTHVSTRVMGTFGYLAPEYAASGKLTEKSDVFSFGIMLLELITGKRPVDNTSDEEDTLVDWARPLLTRALEDGNYDELVDPRLGNNYDRQEMARLIACASASIRHLIICKQIARALEGDVSLEALNETAKPTGQSSIYSSSSDYDTQQYNNDMAKFRKTAFASGDSGDYSGSTGEFGTSSGEMGGKPTRGF